MVVGHPFKGGVVYSTGYLTHPDTNRFGITDGTQYLPPRPDAAITMENAGLPKEAPA